MSLRTSAARYARALFDVTVKESDPIKIEQQLADFVTLVNGNGELKAVLFSPRVPATARKNLIASLVAKAGLEPPLAKLLVMLADRGRFELLPDLLAVFRERLLAHSNVVQGLLASAVPLAPEKLQVLEQHLSKATGKHVRLEPSVDPALVGGVVARIGSTVFDGSVRTQLQKLKQQLLETA
jgi:F-type H+-transporting ATPase subunit delta